MYIWDFYDFAVEGIYGIGIPVYSVSKYQVWHYQGHGHIRDALSPLPVHWNIFPCCLHDLSVQGLTSIYIKDDVNVNTVEFIVRFRTPA